MRREMTIWFDDEPAAEKAMRDRRSGLPPMHPITDIRVERRGSIDRPKFVVTGDFSAWP